MDRWCSFLRNAPPTWRELKPAEVMFSQRRLPSHDLDWVDFLMVRPEDMKPGIISTGLCGLWLLLPFVFFADIMFCTLCCYLILIPGLIYLADLARSFLSLPVIGCTVASNYTAHDEICSSWFIGDALHTIYLES